MTEPNSVVEILIQGMDCTECTSHVQRAIAGVPGVEQVDVFLGSEKAVVRHEPTLLNIDAIRRAVEQAGYSVASGEGEDDGPASLEEFTWPVLSLFGLVFGAVLFVVVIGEWLGLFETITARVSLPVGLALIVIAGLPVFRKVIQATRQGRIVSHTLMTLGVLAALAVGEWPTAAVVAFFMRVGDYAEHFTTDRARRSVRVLTKLAPQIARVERSGKELEIPSDEVQVGEVVIVRPGERIPVDGEVLKGNATINQATITGEAMPVDVGPGARVYAATIAQLGSLQVRAHQIGRDTTFGRVIRMVEEAEAHRADVQRSADKFSAYYLPVVAGIAALTYLIRRDPLATAAVLVVACSCSFALATPIAMLASIGAAARRGLLIKGGKYLETLARADVLLIDKTGTLTLGEPMITDIRPLNGLSARELLTLAASAERYSEHPLAQAVRQAASDRHLDLYEPVDFQAIPGQGVRALVAGNPIAVGNREMVSPGDASEEALALEAQGKTTLYVARDGELIGLLAAADRLRPEVPQALQDIRELGVQVIELLTGDTLSAAAALAEKLGVSYRAELQPEDKIRIVREYQGAGHTVIMVGDGVNDAPALAQSDVGIAMGAAGSDVALEAAHLALMRDDWNLVPEALRIARRTLRVVHLNIGFTAVYNLAGLSLAALGFLPPILAAAAQALPDLGILANSTRLLRQKTSVAGRRMSPGGS